MSIENVYKTQEDADAAREKSSDAAAKMALDKAVKQKLADASMLESYIEQNQIKAIKTANGVYVQTTKLGVGPKLTNKQFVKIKYTGKTLNGKVFDSNIDAAKGHTDPLDVNLTDDQSLGNGVIPGITEGLLTLQKGTKATIYIPSALGYGPSGAGAVLDV